MDDARRRLGHQRDIVPPPLPPKAEPPPLSSTRVHIFGTPDSDDYDDEESAELANACMDSAAALQRALASLAAEIDILDQCYVDIEFTPDVKELEGEESMSPTFVEATDTDEDFGEANGYAMATRREPSRRKRVVTPGLEIGQGWRSAVDEKGRTFYYNSNLRKKQWDWPLVCMGVTAESTSAETACLSVLSVVNGQKSAKFSQSKELLQDSNRSCTNSSEDIQPAQNGNVAKGGGCVPKPIEDVVSDYMQKDGALDPAGKYPGAPEGGEQVDDSEPVGYKAKLTKDSHQTIDGSEKLLGIGEGGEQLENDVNSMDSKSAKRVQRAERHYTAPRAQERDHSQCQKIAEAYKSTEAIRLQEIKISEEREEELRASLAADLRSHRAAKRYVFGADEEDDAAVGRSSERRRPMLRQRRRQPLPMAALVARHGRARPRRM